MLIANAGLLTEALALVSGAVNIDFGRDDTTKGHEHLRQLGVPEFLWQVIDEEVASVWALLLTGGCDQSREQGLGSQRIQVRIRECCQTEIKYETNKNHFGTKSCDKGRILIIAERVKVETLARKNV